MGFNMRLRLKITAIICIFSLLSYTPSNAFLLPAFLYFGFPAAAVDASLIVHATAGAALWWYNKRNGSKKVGANGDISSDGQVQWVDLKDGKLGTYGADTKNRVAYDDLKSGVEGNPSKYPNLKAGMNKAIPWPMVNKDDVAGEIVNTVSKGQKRITGKNVYTYPATCPGAGACGNGSYTEVSDMVTFRYGAMTCSGLTCYTGSTVLTYATDSTPAPVGWLTGQQFYADASLTNQTTKELQDTFRGEIDDFIKDNPNVIHYEDSSGGDAKSQIPSSAMTDTQISTAAANEARSGATAGSYSNYSSISAQYGSNSPEAQAAYAAYQRDVAAREQAAADEAEAAAASASLPTNAYDSNVESPDKKSIATLLGDYAANSPLAGMIETFQVQTSGATPVVVLGNAWGTELKIDLTRWESFLGTCGQMLLILTHGYAVLVVIRRW